MNSIDDLLGTTPSPDEAIIPPDVQRKRDEKANRLRAEEGSPPLRPMGTEAAVKSELSGAPQDTPRRMTVGDLLDRPQTVQRGGATISSLLGEEPKGEGFSLGGAIKQAGEAFAQASAAYTRMAEHFGQTPELGGAFPGAIDPGAGAESARMEAGAAEQERVMKAEQERRMSGAGFLGQAGLGIASFVGGHPGMLVPGAGVGLTATQEMINQLDESYARRKDQGASEEAALRAGGIDSMIGGGSLLAFGPVTKGMGAVVDKTMGSLEGRFGVDTLKRVLTNGLAASGVFASQAALESFVDRVQFPNPNESWDQWYSRVEGEALQAAAQGSIMGVTGLLPGGKAKPYTKEASDLNETNRTAADAVAKEPPKEPKPRLKGPPGTATDAPPSPTEVAATAEAQGTGAKAYEPSGDTVSKIDSLPPVEEGKVRIYRAHGGEDDSDPSSGRWGTSSEQDLEGYLQAKRGAGKPADIRYFDASPEEERTWRGDSQEEDVKRWTNAPSRDYFLPEDAEWKTAKAPAALTDNEIALSNKAGGFSAGFQEFGWVNDAAGGAAKPREVRVSSHDADNPHLGRIASIIQHVLDKYKMDFGVTLGTKKMGDAINAETASGGIFPTGKTGTLGMWLSTGLKTGIIYLNEDYMRTNPNGTAFTALHEFGHALMKHMFDRAPRAIQQALRTEYMTMMRGAWEGKETFSSFYHKFFGKAAAEAHGWDNLAKMDQASLLASAKSFTFSEWLANRFAEHEAREGPGDSPVARYFTHSLGLMERTHREVSASLGFENTFHDWIQGLSERGEYDPATKRLVEHLNDRYDLAVRAAMGLMGQERGFFRDAKLEDLRRIQPYMTLGKGTLEGRDFALAAAYDPRTGIDIKFLARVFEGQDTGAFAREPGPGGAESQVAPAEKARQALSYEKVEDHLEKMLVRTPEGRDVARDRKARISADITYFGKFLGFTGGLLDIANKNLHIPGVRWFKDRIQQYHIDKMTIKSVAMDNLKEWDNIGDVKGAIVGRVLFEEDLIGRRLTPQELIARGFDQPNPATPNQVSPMHEVYNKVVKHFDHILGRMETSALRNAILAFQSDPAKMQVAMRDIRQQFRNMKAKPYFPHSRFGDYGLAVKASRDFTHNGKRYKKGETVSVTHHETKVDRDNWNGEMRAQMGRQNLEERPYDIKDTTLNGMQGLPPEFANHLSQLLGLTVKQNEALRDLQYKMAPHQSFLKHLVRRKGTTGFSTDAKRVYASYMQRAANGISRMEHIQGLRDDIAEMRRSASDLSQRGIDPGQRNALAGWFEKTLEYMQNPGHEYSALRAMGFLWFLGFNVKSAAVNLTQPLITTWPYLAARHGDLRTVAAMSKAFAKSIGTFDLVQDLAAKMKFKLPNGKLLSADEKTMLEQGKKEGWYDETQGALLAGVADPSVFSRYVNKNGSDRLWRGFTSLASAPFRYTELFNRKATAIAAYNLARGKGLPHQDAVAFTRDAVQKTQFEYAQWNRPEWVRGRKGALFLFGQYEANVLRFAFGGDKGWWRSQLALLTLGGVAGVPLAGMAMDLVDLAKKFTSPNQASDTRKDIEDFLQGLNLNSDLIMNGISRYTMGLGLIEGMPQLDISSSIQMGYTRFLGGRDLTKDLKSGDANRMVQDQISNWGGPLANFGVNVYKAAVSDEMDGYRRWSQVLPPFAKAMGEAWRRSDPTSDLAQALNPSLPWYLQATGGKREKNGAVTLPYNYDDWEARAEHMAKYFNFEGTKQTQQAETEQSAREAINFYKARRAVLTKAFATMYREKDREGMADAKAAIERYNREAPHDGIKISPQDLMGEVKRMMGSKESTEHGIPQGVTKRYYDVYKDYSQRRRAVTTPNEEDAPSRLDTQ